MKTRSERRFVDLGKIGTAVVESVFQVLLDGIGAPQYLQHAWREMSRYDCSDEIPFVRYGIQSAVGQSTES